MSEEGTTFQVFRAATAPTLEQTDVLRFEGLTPDIRDGPRGLGAAGIQDGSFAKILINVPGFSLAYAWHKSDYPLPLHSHDVDCCYLIIAGDLQVGSEKLGQGDGFFVPGWDAVHVHHRARRRGVHRVPPRQLLEHRVQVPEPGVVGEGGDHGERAPRHVADRGAAVRPRRPGHLDLTASPTPVSRRGAVEDGGGDARDVELGDVDDQVGVSVQPAAGGHVRPRCGRAPPLHPVRIQEAGGDLRPDDVVVVDAPRTVAAGASRTTWTTSNCWLRKPAES